MASSNSDPNNPAEDLNEGDVGAASLIPARVDYVAVIKATAIAFLAGFASMAIAAFSIFWFMPVDVSDNADTIEIPFAYRALMLVLGHLPSVLGGYLAATFAGRNFILHAVVAGIALLAIGGAYWLIPSDDQFTLVHGITLVLAVPLAAVGGVARAWQEKLG